VAEALRGAVAKGRVGHGYLLTGPRGVGKTTAARILAMALNCERQDPAQPTGEPCGECAVCQRIWSGGASHDGVEIDAASNRSVDDARDLRERAMYAASTERGYKVYIVDEAHMLTREAWNALLKILEEPPPRVVFVFATTEPQKIANTAAPVLSRLQRFDFRRIGAAAIRDRLREVLAAERLEADDDALALISRYADGGMRDALSVLDQALSLSDGSLTAERVRRALGLIGDESYAAALSAVAARDPAGIFPVVDQLMAAGADLVEFMNGLAELLRALLMVGTGVEPDGLTTQQRETIAAAKQSLTTGDVLRMLGLLTTAEAALRRSANPRLVVETLLLRWAVMDRTVDLEDVLRRMPAGGGGDPGTARPPAPRVAPAPPRQDPSPRAPQAGSARPPAERGPVVSGPLTLESLEAAWPEIVARAREGSPLLGAVLEALAPVSAEPGAISVSAGNNLRHMKEGAGRQLAAIEETLRASLGTAVKVSIVDGPDRVEATRPKRLSDK
jgi:DNA polymerase-3 subunit gamma/tau